MHDLYYVMIAADDALQASLVAAFGKCAVHRRYDADLSEWPLVCRELKERFLVAAAAYRAQWLTVE